MTTVNCRSQRTLAKEISYSGIGLHTGQQVTMKLCPAPVDTGIIFKRVDLPHQPEIPATLDHVVDTQRSTTIGIKEVVIHTIEHVMAAVRASCIDNLWIEVSSIEPPVGNGSSDVFVEMIENAGIKEQEGVVPILKLTKPVYWSHGEIHNVAIPCDEYKISYTLNYPECPVLKAQYHSFTVSSENFKREIAPCRTFSRYEEVSFLMDQGLIKGGSLDNAVMIKDGAVISKGGLFFQNEMARHKILDVLGDLALIGHDFRAHIISIRSGHTANYALAKELSKSFALEKQPCL